MNLKRRVNSSNKDGGLKVTLPPVVAKALRVKQGDSIEFTIEENSVNLRKAVD